MDIANQSLIAIAKYNYCEIDNAAGAFATEFTDVIASAEISRVHDDSSAVSSWFTDVIFSQLSLKWLSYIVVSILLFKDRQLNSKADVEKI